MIQVATNYKGYDFYIEYSGIDKHKIYNIVPTGSNAPSGGYRSQGYIEHIKHVQFPECGIWNKV